jgi:type IV secretory pathway VirB2 component (pilin)
MAPITHLLQNIQTLLQGVGLAICVIGIMVGGLMRATAFGNERKIATSNMALSCAVVGFVIVLVATTAGTTIQHFMQ